MRSMPALLLALLMIFAAGCEQQGDAPIAGPGGAPQLNLDYKINSLNEILKKDPENKDALIELGNAYMDTQRCSAAITYYMRALELEPRNQNVRVDMGTCQRRIGRPDLAMEAFREAIKQDPNHAYAHMNLGIVLVNDMNRPEEAIKEFETYLRLAPGDRNAPQIRQFVENLKAQVAAQ